MEFRGKHIHLIGIGGSGLSAIARVLMEQGAAISGSDLVMSPVAKALSRDGARVFEGHSASNLDGAELVVTSSAIPASNVEVQAARAGGIPVLRRHDLLGRMMDGRVGVAIAGTHGKTTTTAMIATILLAADLDPTFVVGGVVLGLGTNARAGQGSVFLVEADEYDRTFLGLSPRVAAVTNVEHDHPDCFPTFADVRAAFGQFVARVPHEGLVAACADDSVARDLGAHRRSKGGRTVLFGLGSEAEWRAEEMRTNFAGGVDFLAVRQGDVLGLVRLRQPGAHNASNAMAALVVADFLGVPFQVSRGALTGFLGVARRFELKGEIRNVAVVDDYAHHPTEIRATLRAGRTRYPDRPIWAIWQPHTYSRSKALIDGFAAAFADADHVIVLPIYPAREAVDLGINAAALAAEIRSRDVSVVGSLEEAVDLLSCRVQPGDVVLTLGAGDGNKVGDQLLQTLAVADWGQVGPR